MNVNVFILFYSGMLLSDAQKKTLSEVRSHASVEIKQVTLRNAFSITLYFSDKCISFAFLT